MKAIFIWSGYMNYIKNVWKDGDIISSERLNHMEEGIANVSGDFELKRNKVVTIDGSAEDDNYPSAKAVYDFFNLMNGEVMRW